jgi:hypothetical protein
MVNMLIFQIMPHMVSHCFPVLIPRESRRELCSNSKLIYSQLNSVVHDQNFLQAPDLFPPGLRTRSTGFWIAGPKTLRSLTPDYLQDTENFLLKNEDP